MTKIDPFTALMDYCARRHWDVKISLNYYRDGVHLDGYDGTGTPVYRVQVISYHSEIGDWETGATVAEPAPLRALARAVEEMRKHRGLA